MVRLQVRKEGRYAADRYRPKTLRVVWLLQILEQHEGATSAQTSGRDVRVGAYIYFVFLVSPRESNLLLEARPSEQRRLADTAMLFATFIVVVC